MSLEEYFVNELFTPSLLDGGLANNPFEQNPSSPDFILTDSFIDELFPLDPLKPTKNDLSQQEKHEDVIPDLDLSDIDFGQFSDLIENDQSFDIGSYISGMSFPSPIDSSEYSPSSNDGSFTDESSVNTDRTLPSSPSTSSMITKRSKLNPVERKLRKKTQNKTAAEKYRIKKKSERDQLIDRHTQLKSLNQNLRLEFENLSFRVEQLKKLLVDVVQVPFV